MQFQAALSADCKKNAFITTYKKKKHGRTIKKTKQIPAIIRFRLIEWGNAGSWIPVTGFFSIDGAYWGRFENSGIYISKFLRGSNIQMRKSIGLAYLQSEFWARPYLFSFDIDYIPSMR